MNFDTLSGGTGPTQNGSPNGGSLVRYPIEICQTPLLDLTQAALGIELVPAKPNHIPLLFGANWSIEKVVGTQVTPATARAGNDAARTNFMPLISTSPSNADVNGANVPSISTSVSFPTAANKQIANAPVLLDIPSPAAGTGGFILLAKLNVSVIWVSVS